MEWDGLMEDRSKNNKIETKDKSEGPEAEVGEEVFYGDTVLESALAFSCAPRAGVCVTGWRRVTRLSAYFGFVKSCCN